MNSKSFVKNLLNTFNEKKYTYIDNVTTLKNIYIFIDKEDLKKYFIDNGFNNISNDILEKLIIITTKQGYVVTSKEVCDYLITMYKKDSNIMENEQFYLKTYNEFYSDVNNAIKKFKDNINNINNNSYEGKTLKK